MPSDVENIIIEQLRELRGEIHKMRSDIQTSLIDIGVLKAKVFMIGAISAVATSAIVHWVSEVFFS